jgi:alpha-galactosidase
MEPEMVSVDSELYRAHPDWCIHLDGRRRSECRNQLTLDLSRKDVCDWLIETIHGILNEAPISYVKWDMNRHMSNIGSALLPSERQKEVPHRYMLGLYHVLEEITSAHPEVLFESCSGGGGRFDPGMLYYMPQTWTSDDTDPVERLFIQYGTSLVYPVSTMGAHVSAVPNHQTGRTPPLKMRGDVAMSGNFGYELDLTAFTEDEKQQVREQIQYYKEIQTLVAEGDMYRLASPFEGNTTAWMFVSEEKDEFFFAYFRIQAKVNPAITRIRLQGICPDVIYQCKENGICYRGDELMEIGLIMDVHGDYQSVTCHFVRI